MEVGDKGGLIPTGIGLGAVYILQLFIMKILKHRAKVNYVGNTCLPKILVIF